MPLAFLLQWLPQESPVTALLCLCSRMEKCSIEKEKQEGEKREIYRRILAEK